MEISNDLIQVSSELEFTREEARMYFDLCSDEPNQILEAIEAALDRAQGDAEDGHPRYIVIKIIP